MMKWSEFEVIPAEAGGIFCHKKYFLLPAVFILSSS